LHNLKKANSYHLSLSLLSSFWDWDEKIRLAARFKVAYSGGIYVDYRIHPHGMGYERSDRNLLGMIGVYEKNKALIKQLPMLEQIYVQKNVESSIHDLGAIVNNIPINYTFDSLIKRLHEKMFSVS